MPISSALLESIKSKIVELVPIDKDENVTPVTQYRDEVLASTILTIKKLLRKPITLIGTYCVQDTVLPIELAEKFNIRTNMEQMSNIMNIPISYLHVRGQQIRVLAQVYRETLKSNIIIPFYKKITDDTKLDEETKGYQGATVIEANAGDYVNVATLDFASLYPSMIIAYNICFTTIVREDDPIPDKKCHVLEWSEHIGCEHDEQKRKRPKNKILCGKHRYRFKRVTLGKDGKLENQGLMPILLINILGERKIVKKEMEKAEAKLKMDAGLASDQDIEIFKNKLKIDIIKKGSLTSEERKNLSVLAKVLNARQLALKVCANSAYGSMGALTGYMPFIEGAASVTAMGRSSIYSAIDYIKSIYIFTKLVYGDSVTKDTPILCRYKGNIFYRTIDDLPVDEWHKQGEKYIGYLKNFEVWSDMGFTTIKKVIKHKTDKKIYRILTHTGYVSVTEDHSLLNEFSQKISPKNVKVGTTLLHQDLPDINGTTNIPCSYSKGLFYGDGSCGFYKCPSGNKYSWAINNLNKNYLNTAKDELEKYYTGYKFKILDTVKSSGVYKLVPVGDLKSLVLEWRDLFYDKRKYKKVPDVYFSASLLSRKKFLKGYYCADGDKDKNGYYRFDNKGQIGSAGLYHLASSLGMPISINIRNDKPDIYRMTATQNGRKQRKNPDKIKKIVCLGPCDDYVYDLETENHHFGAGVGRMIVHNTDSCMLIFEGKTLQESFAIAKEASQRVSHHLKCKTIGVKDDEKLNDEQKKLYDSVPIDLSFENMYGRYLLLTKKRYVAYVVNEKGDVTKPVEKGVVLSRRDNTMYLKKTYKKLINAILDNKTETEFMYILYDSIRELFTRQVDPKYLVIYKAIKNVIDYAKKDKQKKFFIDSEGDAFKDPDGPLDNRLQYPSLGHLQLALKMIERGDTVPANTRLEYVFVCPKDDNKNLHEGDYMEDYTYFIENKYSQRLRLDYLHYLEKQLVKPVAELLRVKYKKEEYDFVKSDELVIQEINKLPPYRKLEIDKKRGFDRKITYITETFNKDRYKDLFEAISKYRSKTIIDNMLKQHGYRKKPERKPPKGKRLVRDSKIMENILEYHKQFQKVMIELKSLFAPKFTLKK
jgi:DNA polymerase elongation subunit (family B)